MSKEIKAPKVVKDTKKDQIKDIIRKGISDVYDRAPNGSLNEADLGKLVEEILKVK